VKEMSDVEGSRAAGLMSVLPPRWLRRFSWASPTLVLALRRRA